MSDDEDPFGWPERVIEIFVDKTFEAWWRLQQYSSDIRNLEDGRAQTLWLDGGTALHDDYRSGAEEANGGGAGRLSIYGRMGLRRCNGRREDGT